jgi:hypothetical protein
MTFDPRYLKGIEYFNTREFFDAHEIWEELWHEQHGDARNFVQGLIQFATALHHFQAENLKGTKQLYTGGLELLTPYGEKFWDLPVKKLIDEMTACVHGLLGYDYTDLPGRYDSNKHKFPVKIDPTMIPKINLRSTSPAS